MLFYKPEKYLLPQSGHEPAPFSRHSQYTMASSIKADQDPTRGAAGDPYKPPVRYADIIKQKPIDQPPPRFIRDQIAVDDINGTRPRSIYRGVAKDIISTKDIDGTSPKYEKMKPKAYDLMDVSDVNQKKKHYQSMRDPLNPVYIYQQKGLNNDMQNMHGTNMLRYGEIEGARPKVMVKDYQEMLNKKIEPTWLTNQKYAMLRPEPQKSLDLTMNSMNNGGLSPDQMSVKSIYRSKIDVSPEKYDYYGNAIPNKDVMKVDDIQGAHSGSLHKTTMRENNRQVNPLEPSYNYPGGRELQSQIDLYNSMKSQYANKNNQINQPFAQPNAGQQNNDSVFMRSSLNTIHGDKYSELVRTQSLAQNIPNQQSNFSRIGLNQINNNNNRYSDQSQFQTKSMNQSINYDEHPGKSQIFQRQMML